MPRRIINMEEFATKQDIKNLEARIDRVEIRLDARIDKVEQVLRGEIEDLAMLIKETMASKEDLAAFTTKEDLKALRAEIYVNFATKAELQAFRDEMNENFDRMFRLLDGIAKSVQDLKEENIAIHDRIDRIEQHIGLRP